MKSLNIYNSSNTILPVHLYGEAIEIKPKQFIEVKTGVWLGDENFKIIDTNPHHEWKEAYTGRYNQNIIFRQENEVATFSCNN